MLFHTLGFQHILSHKYYDFTNGVLLLKTLGGHWLLNALSHLCYCCLKVLNYTFLNFFLIFTAFFGYLKICSTCVILNSKMVKIYSLIEFYCSNFYGPWKKNYGGGNCLLLNFAKIYTKTNDSNLVLNVSQIHYLLYFDV